MYGLSDHSNIIPLTRLRALLQGSSRYSTCTPGSLEHTFVLAEYLRCGEVEAVGCSRRGEGRRDLLHLAGPAPPLRLGGALCSREPLLEPGDRLAPFGAERLLDPLGPCDVADREQERRAPFRPRGVGRLDR